MAFDPLSEQIRQARATTASLFADSPFDPVPYEPGSLYEQFLSRGPEGPMLPRSDLTSFQQGVVHYETPQDPAAPRAAAFRGADLMLLDDDLTGEKTVVYGRSTGQSLSRSDIVSLNVFGKVMSADQLNSSDAGRKLLDIARKNREGVRRNFTEALTDFQWSDLPILGMIASVGGSIRDAVSVSQTMKKLQNGEDVSDDELIKTRLYFAESERRSNGTWGATIGDIVRQAPGFMVEIWALGGMNGAIRAAANKSITKGSVFWGATTADKVLAANTMSTAVRNAAASQLGEAVGESVGRGAARRVTAKIAELGVDGLRPLVKDGALNTIKAGLKATGGAAGGVYSHLTEDELGRLAEGLFESNLREMVARSTGGTVRRALTAAGRNAGHAAARGLLDFGMWEPFGGHVAGDITAGRALARALEVFAVEAPVNGALLFGERQAIRGAASAALGTETVSESQLSLQASALAKGDRRLMDNAESISMGLDMLEYISEHTGEGFNALLDAGMLKFAPKVVARAREAGRMAEGATRPEGGWFGAYIAKHLGTTEDLMKQVRSERALHVGRALRNAGVDIEDAKVAAFTLRGNVDVLPEAARRVVGRDGARYINDVVRKAYKDAGDQYKYKVFWRYAMADWMAQRGFGPGNVVNAFKQAGYDGVLAEMSEERYADIARAMFGLDDESAHGFVTNAKRALETLYPTQENVNQWLAEAVGFSVPMVTRAAVARLQAGLMDPLGRSGTLGVARAATSQWNDFTRVGGDVMPMTAAEYDAASAEAIASQQARVGELRAEFDALPREASGEYTPAADKRRFELETEIKDAESAVALAESRRKANRDEIAADNAKRLESGLAPRETFMFRVSPEGQSERTAQRMSDVTLAQVSTAAEEYDEFNDTIVDLARALDESGSAAAGEDVHSFRARFASKALGIAAFLVTGDFSLASTNPVAYALRDAGMAGSFVNDLARERRKVRLEVESRMLREAVAEGKDRTAVTPEAVRQRVDEVFAPRAQALLRASSTIAGFSRFSAVEFQAQAVRMVADQLNKSVDPGTMWTTLPRDGKSTVVRVDDKGRILEEKTFDEFIAQNKASFDEAHSVLTRATYRILSQGVNSDVIAATAAERAVMRVARVSRDEALATDPVSKAANDLILKYNAYDAALDLSGFGDRLRAKELSDSQTLEDHVTRFAALPTLLARGMLSLAANPDGTYSLNRLRESDAGRRMLEAAAHRLRASYDGTEAGLAARDTVVFDAIRAAYTAVADADTTLYVTNLDNKHFDGRLCDSAEATVSVRRGADGFRIVTREGVNLAQLGESERAALVEAAKSPFDTLEAAEAKLRDIGFEKADREIVLAPVQTFVTSDFITMLRKLNLMEEYRRRTMHRTGSESSTRVHPALERDTENQYRYADAAKPVEGDARQTWQDRFREDLEKARMWLPGDPGLAEYRRMYGWTTENGVSDAEAEKRMAEIVGAHDRMFDEESGYVTVAERILREHGVSIDGRTGVTLASVAGADGRSRYSANLSVIPGRRTDYISVDFSRSASVRASIAYTGMTLAYRKNVGTYMEMMRGAAGRYVEELDAAATRRMEDLRRENTPDSNRAADAIEAFRDSVLRVRTRLEDGTVDTSARAMLTPQGFAELATAYSALMVWQKGGQMDETAHGLALRLLAPYAMSCDSFGAFTSMVDRMLGGSGWGLEALKARAGEPGATDTGRGLISFIANVTGDVGSFREDAASAGKTDFARFMEDLAREYKKATRRELDPDIRRMIQELAPEVARGSAKATVQYVGLASQLVLGYEDMTGEEQRAANERVNDILLSLVREMFGDVAKSPDFRVTVENLQSQVEAMREFRGTAADFVSAVGDYRADRLRVATLRDEKSKLQKQYANAMSQVSKLKTRLAAMGEAGAPASETDVVRQDIEHLEENLETLRKGVEEDDRVMKIVEARASGSDVEAAKAVAEKLRRAADKAGTLSARLQRIVEMADRVVSEGASAMEQEQEPAPPADDAESVGAEGDIDLGVTVSDDPDLISDNPALFADWFGKVLDERGDEMVPGATWTYNQAKVAARIAAAVAALPARVAGDEAPQASADVDSVMAALDRLFPTGTLSEVDKSLVRTALEAGDADGPNRALFLGEITADGDSELPAGEAWSDQARAELMRADLLAFLAVAAKISPFTGRNLQDFLDTLRTNVADALDHGALPLETAGFMQDILSPRASDGGANANQRAASLLDTLSAFDRPQDVRRHFAACLASDPGSGQPVSRAGAFLVAYYASLSPDSRSHFSGLFSSSIGLAPIERKPVIGRDGQPVGHKFVMHESRTYVIPVEHLDGLIRSMQRWAGDKKGDAIDKATETIKARIRKFAVDNGLMDVLTGKGRDFGAADIPIIQKLFTEAAEAVRDVVGAESPIYLAFRNPYVPALLAMDRSSRGGSALYNVAAYLAYGNFAGDLQLFAKGVAKLVKASPATLKRVASGATTAEDAIRVLTQEMLAVGLAEAHEGGRDRADVHNRLRRILTAYSQLAQPTMVRAAVPSTSRDAGKSVVMVGRGIIPVGEGFLDSGAATGFGSIDDLLFGVRPRYLRVARQRGAGVAATVEGRTLGDMPDWYRAEQLALARQKPVWSDGFRTPLFARNISVDLLPEDVYDLCRESFYHAFTDLMGNEKLAAMISRSWSGQGDPSTAELASLSQYKEVAGQTIFVPVFAGEHSSAVTMQVPLAAIFQWGALAAREPSGRQVIKPVKGNFDMRSLARDAYDAVATYFAKALGLGVLRHDAKRSLISSNDAAHVPTIRVARAGEAAHAAEAQASTLDYAASRADGPAAEAVLDVLNTALRYKDTWYGLDGASAATDILDQLEEEQASPETKVSALASALAAMLRHSPDKVAKIWRAGGLRALDMVKFEGDDKFPFHLVRSALHRAYQVAFDSVKPDAEYGKFTLGVVYNYGMGPNENYHGSTQSGGALTANLRERERDEKAGVFKVHVEETPGADGVHGITIVKSLTVDLDFAAGTGPGDLKAVADKAFVRNLSDSMGNPVDGYIVTDLDGLKVNPLGNKPGDILIEVLSRLSDAQRKSGATTEELDDLYAKEIGRPLADLVTGERLEKLSDLVPGIRVVPAGEAEGQPTVILAWDAPAMMALPVANVAHDAVPRLGTMHSNNVIDAVTMDVTLDDQDAPGETAGDLAAFWGVAQTALFGREQVLSDFRDKFMDQCRDLLNSGEDPNGQFVKQELARRIYAVQHKNLQLPIYGVYTPLVSSGAAAKKDANGKYVYNSITDYTASPMRRAMHYGSVMFGDEEREFYRVSRRLAIAEVNIDYRTSGFRYSWFLDEAALDVRPEGDNQMSPREAALGVVLSETRPDGEAGPWTVADELAKYEGQKDRQTLVVIEGLFTALRNAKTAEEAAPWRSRIASIFVDHHGKSINDHVWTVNGKRRAWRDTFQFGDLFVRERGADGKLTGRRVFDRSAIQIDGDRVQLDADEAGGVKPGEKPKAAPRIMLAGTSFGLPRTPSYNGAKWLQVVRAGLPRSGDEHEDESGLFLVDNQAAVSPDPFSNEILGSDHDGDKSYLYMLNSEDDGTTQYLDPKLVDDAIRLATGGEAGMKAAFDLLAKSGFYTAGLTPNGAKTDFRVSDAMKRRFSNSFVQRLFDQARDLPCLIRDKNGKAVRPSDRATWCGSVYAQPTTTNPMTKRGLQELLDFTRPLIDENEDIAMGPVGARVSGSADKASDARGRAVSLSRALLFAFSTGAFNDLFSEDGKPITGEQFIAFMDRADAIPNATFDDIKNQICSRLGWTPETLDTVISVCIESGHSSDSGIAPQTAAEMDAPLALFTKSYATGGWAYLSEAMRDRATRRQARQWFLKALAPTRGDTRERLSDLILRTFGVTYEDDGVTLRMMTADEVRVSAGAKGLTALQQVGFNLAAKVQAEALDSELVLDLMKRMANTVATQGYDPSSWALAGEFLGLAEKAAGIELDTLGSRLSRERGERAEEMDARMRTVAEYSGEAGSAIGDDVERVVRTARIRDLINSAGNVAKQANFMKVDIGNDMETVEARARTNERTDFQRRTEGRPRTGTLRSIAAMVDASRETYNTAYREAGAGARLMTVAAHARLAASPAGYAANEAALTAKTQDSEGRQRFEPTARLRTDILNKIRALRNGDATEGGETAPAALDEILDRQELIANQGLAPYYVATLIAMPKLADSPVWAGGSSSTKAEAIGAWLRGLGTALARGTVTTTGLKPAGYSADNGAAVLAWIEDVFALMYNNATADKDLGRGEGAVNPFTLFSIGGRGALGRAGNHGIRADERSENTATASMVREWLGRGLDRLRANRAVWDRISVEYKYVTENDDGTGTEHKGIITPDVLFRQLLPLYAACVEQVSGVPRPGVASLHQALGTYGALSTWQAVLAGDSASGAREALDMFAANHVTEERDGRRVLSPLAADGALHDIARLAMTGREGTMRATPHGLGDAEPGTYSGSWIGALFPPQVAGENLRADRPGAVRAESMAKAMSNAMGALFRGLGKPGAGLSVKYIAGNVFLIYGNLRINERDEAGKITTRKPQAVQMYVTVAPAGAGSLLASADSEDDIAALASSRAFFNSVNAAVDLVKIDGRAVRTYEEFMAVDAEARKEYVRKHMVGGAAAGKVRWAVTAKGVETLIGAARVTGDPKHASMVYHEYFHMMCSMFESLGLWSAEDIVTLRARFGEPPAKTGWLFNQENAAEAFRKFVMDRQNLKSPVPQGLFSRILSFLKNLLGCLRAQFTRGTFEYGGENTPADSSLFTMMLTGVTFESKSRFEERFPELAGRRIAVADAVSAKLTEDGGRAIEDEIAELTTQRVVDATRRAGIPADAEDVDPNALVEATEARDRAVVASEQDRTGMRVATRNLDPKARQEEFRRQVVRLHQYINVPGAGMRAGAESSASATDVARVLEGAEAFLPETAAEPLDTDVENAVSLGTVPPATPAGAAAAAKRVAGTPRTGLTDYDFAGKMLTQLILNETETPLVDAKILSSYFRALGDTPSDTDLSPLLRRAAESAISTVRAATGGESSPDLDHNIVYQALFSLANQMKAQRRYRPSGWTYWHKKTDADDSAPPKGSDSSSHVSGYQFAAWMLSARGTTADEILAPAIAMCEEIEGQPGRSDALASAARYCRAKLMLAKNAIGEKHGYGMRPGQLQTMFSRLIGSLRAGFGETEFDDRGVPLDARVLTRAEREEYEGPGSSFAEENVGVWAPLFGDEDHPASSVNEAERSRAQELYHGTLRTLYTLSSHSKYCNDMGLDMDEADTVEQGMRAKDGPLSPGEVSDMLGIGPSATLDEEHSLTDPYVQPAFMAANMERWLVSQLRDTFGKQSLRELMLQGRRDLGGAALNVARQVSLINMIMGVNQDEGSQLLELEVRDREWSVGPGMNITHGVVLDKDGRPLQYIGFDNKGMKKNSAGVSFTENELRMVRMYMNSIAVWANGDRELLTGLDNITVDRREAKPLREAKDVIEYFNNIARDNAAKRQLTPLQYVFQRMVEWQLWDDFTGVKYDERTNTYSWAGAANAGRAHELFEAAKHILLDELEAGPVRWQVKTGRRVRVDVAPGDYYFEDETRDSTDTELSNEVLRRLHDRGLIQWHDFHGQLRGVLTLDVDEINDKFHAHTAFEKLKQAGRVTDKFDLTSRDYLARELVGLYHQVDKYVRANPWMTQGDGRYLNSFRSGIPWFAGDGYFMYHANRKLSDDSALADPTRVDRFAGRLRALLAGKELKDVSTDQWTTLAAVYGLADAHNPEKFRDDVVAGRYAPGTELARRTGLSFDPAGKNSRDVAREIYSRAVEKYWEATRDDFTAPGEPRRMTYHDIIEAWHRAAGDEATVMAPGGLAGVSDSQMYRATGQLPAAFNLGKRIQTAVDQMATTLFYRNTIVNMMMTPNADGTPVYYMKPADDVDDRLSGIPDAVWGELARWWAQVNRIDGVIDESKTGRQNARAVYEAIYKSGKEASSSNHKRIRVHAPDDPKRSLSYGVLGRGDLDGCGLTIEEVLCAGDETRGEGDNISGINALAGGEARGYALHLFQAGRTWGIGNAVTRAVINRVFSWSKSMSVGFSFFFPIATKWESPVGAIGAVATLGSNIGKVGEFYRRHPEILKVLPGAGWITKDFFGGADAQKLFDTNDPYIADLIDAAQAMGVTLSTPVNDPLEIDRGAVRDDIANIEAKLRRVDVKMARNFRTVADALLLHQGDAAFTYALNATKLAVVAQMVRKLRYAAEKSGKAFDPLRDLRRFSNYINAEIGGLDDYQYAWNHPMFRSFMGKLLFSWGWTRGAWEAGGGGVIEDLLFGGHSTTPEMRRQFIGRWARMFGEVMIGLPMLMQMLCKAVSMIDGEDDDDDKWFTWQNEEKVRKGYLGTAWDITPLMKFMHRHENTAGPIGRLGAAGAGAWYLGRFNPWLGALGAVGGLAVGDRFVPNYRGKDPFNQTTGNRRYYEHFGKQGWEFWRWFDDPAKQFLSKLSMPVQNMVSWALGHALTDPNVKDDRSLVLAMADSFVPFTATGMGLVGNGGFGDAGVLPMLSPIQMGVSRTKAQDKAAGELYKWALNDRGGFRFDRHRRVAKRGVDVGIPNLNAMVEDARRNGNFDTAGLLSQAFTDARQKLLRDFFRELPDKPDGDFNTEKVAKLARALNRLGTREDSVMRSLKTRLKNRGLDWDKDWSAKTPDGMTPEQRWTYRAIVHGSLNHPFDFESWYSRQVNPYSVREAANGGSNLGNFLATDKVPDTIFGIPVTQDPQTYTREDLAFFKDHPEAAGYYQLEGDNNGAE